MSTPTPPVVRTERIGSTLLITLDRPEARNAVNAATATALAAALDALEADPTLRAGVLTGEGGTFSAGMDLKAALRGESPEVEGRGFGGLTEARPDKPLIAAVEGFAMGGGFELALACDLIVAAEDARFGLPEVKRGLIAAGGGVIRLPRRASRTTSRWNCCSPASPSTAAGPANWAWPTGSRARGRPSPRR